jgi:hypothetical protein
VSYVPTDFGVGKSGPQIPWYRWRLAVHGYLSAASRPALAWTEQDRLDTQKLQLAQGWKGTYPGGGADGLPGFKTLAVMAAEPKVVDPPPPPPPPLPTYPAQVLNLANWKLTLPTGQPESPTEIKQPALATFKAGGLF